MGSLDYVNLNAFAPQRPLAQPSVLDYFQQGQGAVQSVLDAQYQAHTRAALLAERQRQERIASLLEPVQIQQANLGLQAQQRTADNAAILDPIKQQEAALNLQKNQAELDAYKLDHPAGGYPFLGTGQTTIGPSGGIDGTTVRQTHYYPGEAHSDPDTDAGRTSTGGPLLFAKPDVAGTAAVDPSVIPYGSIIQRADGKTFVAGDTGGAVKSRVASHGGAPVIDFADTDTSVPDYGPVKILPPAADYVKLSPGQKLAYHAMAAGLAGKGQQIGVPDVVASTTPLISSAALAQPVTQADDLPADASSANPSLLTGDKVAMNYLNTSAPEARPAAPMMTGRGYIDPVSHQAVFTNDRLLVPPGTTFGLVQKPAPNANQAKADLALIKSAPKGYDGDTTLDANGELTEQQRQDIRSAQKEAFDHKGTAIPAKTRDAARQMGVPIEGKSFDEVTQALQDKQMQDGLIPPELRVAAERLQSQIYQHPLLKDYPKLREAKESFDAGYNNQDTGGFGDMALVEGMQRMLNPGMGVRAQTMTQMLKGAGLAQYLSPSFIAEHIAQGEKFSPEVRERMKKLADDIFARANANAAPALNGMKRQAKAYGVPNPDDFVNNVLTIAPVLDAGAQPDSSPANGNLKTPDANTLAAARAAIPKKGKDAVAKFLQSEGYDASGL